MVTLRGARVSRVGIVEAEIEVLLKQCTHGFTVKEIVGIINSCCRMCRSGVGGGVL